MRASLVLRPDRADFHNNLALLLAVTEGAAPAAQEAEEALRLATAQGARASALELHETLFSCYFMLGRWDDLVQRAVSLLDQVSGDPYTKVIIETSLVRPLVLRGSVARAAELLADLLPAARDDGEPQVLVPALAAAALSAAATGDGEQVARLLEEIESPLADVGEDTRPLLLPELVRLAVTFRDPDDAERLIAAHSTYAATVASVASARATISEARGDLAEAISEYAEAARGWSTLGHVPEHAFALLGLGRSRLAAGDPAGADDLSSARELFAQLRAQPLVAEADQLLGEQERLTS
jgi:tetratricopeptide (TPR) repeat protein